MVGLCLFGINFVVLSLISMLINFIIYYKKDIMVDPNQTMSTVVMASYIIAIVMAKHFGV